jgi:hypothetical protein
LARAAVHRLVFLVGTWPGQSSDGTRYDRIIFDGLRGLAAIRPDPTLVPAGAARLGAQRRQVSSASHVGRDVVAFSSWS